MVAAIVLAAGASTRMGRSKALLPWEAGTVLSTVVDRLLLSPIEGLVVVLGHEADDVQARAQLPVDARLAIAVNERWAEGMASSLRAGLEACPEAEAAIVALGDQPGVDPAVVARLMAAWRGGAALAIPVHDGRVGHPVLFDRRLFPELRALAGDVGAKDVVKRHWSEAVQVAAPPLRDLDTPSDYDDLVAGRPASASEGLDVP